MKKVKTIKTKGTRLINIMLLFAITLTASFNSNFWSVDAYTNCNTGTGEVFINHGYRCHTVSGNSSQCYHVWGGTAFPSHIVMSGGVGDYGKFRRYIWIDPTINNTTTYPYKTLALRAVDEWVNTTSAVGITTSVSIRETTTRSSAMFEIEVNNSLTIGGSTAIGFTEFYIYNTKLTPSGESTITQNYGWAKASFNQNEWKSRLTNHGRALHDELTLRVFSHELGHALGLSHNCATDTIMYYNANNMTVNRGSYRDLQTINHLYG